MSEEDRATDIGNMLKKFSKDRACGSGDILADRQTDTQTDILITILRSLSRGRNNKTEEQGVLLETIFLGLLLIGCHLHAAGNTKANDVTKNIRSIEEKRHNSHK